MSRLADALSGTASRSANPAGGLPKLTPVGPLGGRWRLAVAFGMLLAVTSLGGVLIWERGGQAPPAAQGRPTPPLTPSPAPLIPSAPPPGLLSRALLVQGLAAADRGALTEAVALFTKALELHGADADAWNNLGVVLHRQGDTTAGVEAFHRALRVKPEHAEAHRNLGVVLDRLGQLRDATRHYRAYLRRAPEADPTRLAVARRLRELTASRSAP